MDYIVFVESYSQLTTQYTPFFSMASAGIEPHECACIVCLDSDPPPIQSGCACRSDTGLAHVGCLIEKAVAQQPHRGNAVWWECQTCGQQFTGAMQTGLAEAWWSRVCDEAEESAERLAAAGNLADARDSDGQYAEAERIQREVLGVQRRVLGEDHPATLTRANDLAESLLHPGKYAGAARIHRAGLVGGRALHASSANLSAWTKEGGSSIRGLACSNRPHSTESFSDTGANG